MQTIEPTERLALQMARLNAKNVRFDVGAGGGAPSLTPQDIAAALGMVPGGLGRELVLHVHWPDAAKRNRARLLEAMTLAQLEEHNRREMEVNRALCHVAVATPATKHGATRAYSDAQANRWPVWVAKIDTVTLTRAYEHIRLGVLEELAHPRHCPDCHGREKRDRLGQLKPCERCLGAGIVRYGNTWRAKRLGMTRGAFIETWQGPYQWLMDLCREQLGEAELALLRALH